MKELEKIALDLEKINPYLLSGGAGALATGLALSQIKRDPKKSRLADLGRKLAIALGGGLAAAGIHKAINTAGENFSTALPESDVSTEEKIVNTAANPNTTRLLASLGVGGGLFGTQTIADTKLLQKINPDLLDSPTTALKDQLKVMQGPNKLKSYIDAMVDTKGNQRLTDLKNEINALEGKLKNAKGNSVAPLQTKLDEAKNKLIGETNKSKALVESTLRSAGFDVADYEPGRFNKVKQVINPYASRLYGRSNMGRLGKGLAIGGALLSPELFNLAGEAISSKPVE